MANNIGGLNTGLDTASIIQKMTSLEQAPINTILAKANVEKQKLNSFQTLSSQLKTFQSIARTLSTQDQFLATQGVFTNANATATSKVLDITTTGRATSGTYSFSVSNLAREGKIVSQGYRATDSAIPTGAFEIHVGSKTTTIIVDSSNNTPEGLRLAINNSGASVNAAFINDGSANPIRLLISGTQTGTANAVSANMVGLPLFGGVPNTDIMPFTQTQVAQDANLLVNGVSVAKSTNTVTDVIAGTILHLTGTGSGAITLTTDTNAIKSKINAFVTGYNNIMSYLNSQLSIDGSNNTGLLFGNTAVESIQQTLRNSITSPISGVTGRYSYLSQVGISTQRDGTLQIDDGALSTAIATNVGNLSQLFASTGSTSNSAVTYVGFTKTTAAGVYDLRMQNGVPQLSPTGQNKYTNATGSGNFFAGAAGTDAEGLNFRIPGSSADGSYGTITQTVGIADTLNRFLNIQTDMSQNGPLAAEINTANAVIDNNQKTADNMQQRLTLYTNNLQDKFTNLEIVVGRLKSQGEAFASSLSSLPTTSSSGATAKK